MTTTQATKQLLEAALKNLPDNNRTGNIRTYIRYALYEVDLVSKKEKRTQENAITPEQRWKLDLETGQLANPNVYAPNVLKHIEHLIKTEQNKLEELKNNHNKNQNKDGELLI